MNAHFLANWVQIISGIALVAGIGLVIWELQQTREIAEAQFRNENFNAIREENIAMMGERGAEVFAKACDAPDSLTSEDLRIMEAVTYNRLIAIMKRLTTYRVVGFFGQDQRYGWAQFARPNLRAIFGTQFGRNWWRTTRTFWDPEITAIGDEVLSHLGPPNCAEFYDGLRGSQ